MCWLSLPLPDVDSSFGVGAKHSIAAGFLAIVPLSVASSASAQTLSLETQREYARPLCPGRNIFYTIIVPSLTGGLAFVNDPIPANTTYVTGSSRGGATFDTFAHRSSWQGVLLPGGVYRIGFSVTVNPGVPNGTVITNTATAISGGEGFPMQVTVTDTVNCFTPTPAPIRPHHPNHPLQPPELQQAPRPPLARKTPHARPRPCQRNPLLQPHRLHRSP